MKYRCLLILMMSAITLLKGQNTHITVSPECELEIYPDKYVVYFSLPNYALDGYVDEECGNLSRITIPNSDFDVTDEVGYPQLPFYSIHLILPEDVDTVHVTHTLLSIVEESVNYYIEPAKRGHEYAFGNIDDDCINEEYYGSGLTEEYPAGFCQDFYSISRIYSILNSQGVTLSIFPFAYFPESNYMQVLQEAEFTIEFANGNLIATMDSVRVGTDVGSLATQLYYDSFDDVVQDTTIHDNGKYLIVAARQSMENVLSEYISYKQAQHYDVEVLYLDTEGALGNAQTINSLISNNTLMPDPDYILFIGTVSDIPPCQGTSDYTNPYTDDCYPAFHGRWILSEYTNDVPYPSLQRIIQKTILSELAYMDLYSTAVLFSGVHPTISSDGDAFYQSINDIATQILMPAGIPCTLYDGRDYTNDVELAQGYMSQALIGNPRFFIYRGHGGVNGILTCIPDPYMIYPSVISSLNNEEPYPISFGFACSLNSYEFNNSFGANWVSNSAGGVTFYGATTLSMRTENDMLAKRIFRNLRMYHFLQHNVAVSVWLQLAEFHYLFGRLSLNRMQQVRKYTLIGDPTLAISGMNPNGAVAPFHKKEIDNGSAKPYVLENKKEVCRVDIYNLHGNKLYSFNSFHEVSESLPQNGVYVIKTTYSDGTFSIDKILK